jgi:pyrroline-5-carboxylate reductase
MEFLRAMPNTSQNLVLGITALYNSSFKKNNLSKVLALFKKIGIVINLKRSQK